MAYGTTRISASAHEVLRELSRTEGKSMLALLDEAVEGLRRRRFLEQVNEAYAVLRADRRSWEAIESERRAWDATLADGLMLAEGRAPYGARSRRRRGRRPR